MNGCTNERVPLLVRSMITKGLSIDEREAFAQVLRVQMAIENVKQDEVAERVGVSGQTIANACKARYNVGPATLIKIAAVMGFSANEAIGIHEEENGSEANVCRFTDASGLVWQLELVKEES